VGCGRGMPTVEKPAGSARPLSDDFCPRPPPACTRAGMSYAVNGSAAPASRKAGKRKDQRMSVELLEQAIALSQASRQATGNPWLAQRNVKESSSQERCFWCLEKSGALLPSTETSRGAIESACRSQQKLVDESSSQHSGFCRCPPRCCQVGCRRRALDHAARRENKARATRLLKGVARLGDHVLLRAVQQRLQ